MTAFATEAPNPAERRQLGIYYTPNEATRILCSWAIRHADDLLLEPSFGGCGFLRASRERLQELNCHDPRSQLFGCDIDQDAFFNHLMPLFDTHDDLLDHFHAEDFLSITPEKFGQQFSAVIGNPPYISHHRMSALQKKTIERVFAESPQKPHRRADLWVYFVLHSLKFLRPGGRMAWILPGSFLQTDYSVLVREVIEQKFGRSLAIQLGQKLFVSEGAQENTIVVLADGFEQGSNPMRVQHAANLTDLQSLMENWQSRVEEGVELRGSAKSSLLETPVQGCLRELEERYRVQALGDVCAIRIGIVTGANWFFVLNRSTAQEHNLPIEHLRAIVPKFSVVEGLTLSNEDLQRAAAADFACLLLDTRTWTESSADPIGIYLGSLDPDVRSKTKTFGKRSVWHQPDDGRTPDAFLSYMHEHGPRLALNTAQTTCTNTVHRVFFRPELDLTARKAVAIALQSTFGQLCAEIEGRAYGSGVLKHEPSGASRIKFLLPQQVDEASTGATFESIDRLVRDNKPVEARALADRFAMSDFIARQGEEAFAQTCGVLDQALLSLRAKRRHTAAPRPLEPKPAPEPAKA